MNRMLSEKCFSSFPLLFDGLRKTKKLMFRKIIYKLIDILRYECFTMYIEVLFDTIYNQKINFFQTATESIL